MVETYSIISRGMAAYQLYWKISIFNHEMFIQASTEPLKDARKVLETHRDWNHILANVALAIEGLVVFYAVAVLVNKAMTGNLFFSRKRIRLKR